MNDKNRARLLDKALTAMQREDASLADVLAEHPELEASLRPMLEQADSLRDLSPEGPRRVFVVSTKHRLMNRIAHRMRERSSEGRRNSRWFGWLRQPAMALASLALAFVLLLSMTGVVYAASDSLPGEALYGVKRGVERARLSLTLTDEGRIGLLHQYTQERLEEIQALEQSGRSEGLDRAIDAYQSSVDQLVEELSDDGADLAQLEQIEGSLEHHTTVLEDLMTTAPEAAQPGLMNAAEKSTQGRKALEALQEGKSPSELAPGQLKKTGTPDETGGPQGTPPGLDPNRTPGPPEGAGPPDDSPGRGPNR